MKNKLIILLGPTGVGKTDISIELPKLSGVRSFQPIHASFTGK